MPLRPPESPLPPPRPPRIGLALGSGGARGWAHLGVLRRLSELGIRPSCIAGTSIGSIVMALYATHAEATMEELAAHLDWRKVAQLFFEVGLPKSGLLSGRNVIKFLQSVIPARTFEELPVPCAAVATDLDTEHAEIITTGDLFKGIRASIGIPGIFSPTLRDGRKLVDGGLVNPLPVDVCRAMGADIVIGVDINLRHAPSGKTPKAPPHKTPALSPKLAALIASVGKINPRLGDSAKTIARRLAAKKRIEARDDIGLSIFDVLTRSFRLAENEITRRELERNPPDILIQPAVAQIMTLDFQKGEDAIEAGAQAVDEQLKALLPLAAPRLTFK